MMSLCENVYLIGLMGVGKSTLGRSLSQSLRCKYIDTDKEIEQRNGVGIPLIFEYEGEAGFRMRETEVLNDISSQSSPAIVSTGGGLPTIEANRILLKSSPGKIIYLHASPEILYERTKYDLTRPLLQTGDRKLTLRNLYQQRDQIYRGLAHHIIESGKYPVHSAVRKILQFLSSSGALTNT